ncbi:MAG: glycosyltransferase [Anaerolineaceae bacterium]|nr:glycosyltransferase [Anaerolineaceae bacterium]
MKNNRMMISIIIPAYNEELLIESTIRSVVRFLIKNFNEGEIVIVNDGSIDRTQTILEYLIVRNSGKIKLKLINNKQNRGKGYSIKEGMLKSLGEVRIFIDADLPFRLDGIKEIYKRIMDGSDIVIGDRNNPESELVNVSPIRKFAGNVFSAFVQGLVSGGITDTQCGLKGFTADAAQFVFSRTTIDGFGFDVEVLRIAQRHSLRISRLPVQMLNNRLDSRVHLVRDSLFMLWNLVAIKRNEIIGLYD